LSEKQKLEWEAQEKKDGCNKMDEEKIITKITRYLEDKEGLSSKECLSITKDLFDMYFDQTQAIDEEDDDFSEYEEEDDFEDDYVEKKVEEKRIPVDGDYDYETRPKKVGIRSDKIEVKKGGLSFKPVETVETKKVLSQEDIDDGNF